VIPVEHASSPGHPALPAPDGYLRALLQAFKLVLAALLAYAIWRTYQSPDLMLDLSTWRLC